VQHWLYNQDVNKTNKTQVRELFKEHNEQNENREEPTKINTRDYYVVQHVKEES
jgi:hypothetical protein